MFDDSPILINVLGELQVTKDGAACELPASRKTRALLAFLAVTGRPVRREKLCDMFWEIPDDPRGSLRWSLSKIRTAIRFGEEDPLQADRNTVLLRPDAFRLDYNAIANLGLAQVERLDADSLCSAAKLIRGEFLEDLAMPNCPGFEAWRRSFADTVDIMARRIFRTLTQKFEDRPEQALRYLHALQKLDPGDETLRQEAERLALAARTGAMHAVASISQPQPTSLPPAVMYTHREGRLEISSLANRFSRKQPVSVMALEVSHPLQAIEAHDPEMVLAALQPIIELIENTAIEFDGSILSRNQAEFVIEFGAGQPMEDYARRACQAALRLRDIVEASSDKLARLRIAIDTGDAIVCRSSNSNSGSIEVTGAPARLAPQILRLLREGMIVATERTRDAAGGYILMSAAAKSQLGTGIQDHILYEVEAERTGPTRWHLRNERALTSLVGRSAEMQLLRDCWRRSQAGQGAAIAIVGEAGVGKSRVCSEFIKIAKASDAIVAQGGALEADISESYGLIRKLIRSLCGISQSISNPMVSAILDRSLNELGADRHLRQELTSLFEPPIPHASGHGISPAHALGKSIGAIIALVSNQRPLVIIAEDLHWADSGSRRVIETLGEEIARYPILMLSTTRSIGDAGRALKFRTTLQLECLDSESATSMAEMLLGPGPGMDALAEQLAAHSGGNPLFLEETVMMLVQAGILVGRSGGFRLVQSPGQFETPPSAQAIASVRMGALSAEERDTLEIAAVIGTEVPRTILELACERSPDELTRIVNTLKSSGFLVDLHDFPVKSFGFRNALIQTAIRDGLLRERLLVLRKRVHDAAKLHHHKLDSHQDKHASDLAQAKYFLQKIAS
jgi:DNA-binding SARP family transcriptional activator/class 3 adenylate cyclase